MATWLRVLLIGLLVVAPGGFFLLPLLALGQLKTSKKPSPLAEPPSVLLT